MGPVDRQTVVPRKAIVAVARKLAVIHARHVDDGTFYIGDPMPTRKTPQRVRAQGSKLLGDMHEHARIIEMPLSAW